MSEISYVKSVTEEKKEKLTSVRSLTLMGMLSAVAVILMIFEIPLWFAPNFYKIDLSEIPVLIGAFALGPVAGIIIEGVKILLNFLYDGSTTAGVGELSNFLIGCSLVVPSAWIYQKMKTRKAAVIGLAVGVVVLIIVGSILNAYVLLPTYAKVYGMPLQSLIDMGTAVNPAIKGVETFILFAVVPFNLIKGVISSVFTILLYKRISHVFKNVLK